MIMNKIKQPTNEDYKTVQDYYKKDFEIPKDWNYVKYKDLLIEVNDPVLFDNDEFYKLITTKRGNGGLVLRETLQGKDIKTKSLFSVEEGDFIIAKMQIIHGACGLVPKNLVDAKISGSYLRFKTKSLLSSEYLNWFSHTQFFKKQTFISSVGTNIEKMNFDKNHWLEQKMLVPPLEEQERMNSIFSTVDKNISKTQSLITYDQELKIGITQKLLTKGFGHKKFKKIRFYFDEISIPQEWEVVKLVDYTSKIGSGKTPRGGFRVYQNEGIPLIRSQNVHFEGLDLSNVALITKEIHEEMKNSKVKPNDVLLNITGISLGRCTTVPKNFDEANVNQHVCIIRPSKEFDSQYVANFLSSYIGQKMIKRVTHGLSRDGLNFKEIANFKIIKPSLEEQKKISKIFNLVTKRIQKRIELQSSYEDLKKGLVQKLLIGKSQIF